MDGQKYGENWTPHEFLNDNGYAVRLGYSVIWLLSRID